MARGLVFVAWLALVIAGFGFAPPARPDQAAWIADLLLGRWAGENPAVVALFQVMGVWPVLLASLTVDRLGPGPDRRLPAWPFALASFALGAYALLPWFFLPRGGGPLASPSRARSGLAAICGLAGAALIVWGLAAGDLGGLARAARTDGFVWPMSLDFGACTLISIGVVREVGEGVEVVVAGHARDQPGGEPGDDGVGLAPLLEGVAEEHDPVDAPVDEQSERAIEGGQVGVDVGDDAHPDPGEAEHGVDPVQNAVSARYVLGTGAGPVLATGAYIGGTSTPA